MHGAGLMHDLANIMIDERLAEAAEARRTRSARPAEAAAAPPPHPRSLLVARCTGVDPVLAMARQRTAR